MSNTVKTRESKPKIFRGSLAGFLYYMENRRKIVKRRAMQVENGHKRPASQIMTHYHLH